MAGDDHEGRQATSEPAAASSKPGGPGAPSPLSEWTASDARGSLNEVGPVPLATAGGTDPLARDPLDQASVPSPSTSQGTADAASTPAGVAGAEPPTAPVARRASLWPVAAGLLAGALVGAGSAYLVYANAPGRDALDGKVAALTTQVDALNRRPDPAGPLATLKVAVADLSGRVGAVEKQAGSKPAAAETAPGASDLPGKISALQAKLDALQQQSASAGDLAAAQGKLATLATGVADVQKQAGAARTDVQALQSGQKNLEKIIGSPALAVVADSLVQQIGRGLPFATQVNALEALGADPARAAILRQFADAGVPTATALAAKFDPLTDGLLAAGTKLPPNAGFWDRMKSGASGLISIRRVDAVTGDDVPSRVARIKADLARDDVVDAVKTWEALPAEAKSKPDSAAWGALAKTHAEAIGAANAIQHDAIAAFAAKKS